MTPACMCNQWGIRSQRYLFLRLEEELPFTADLRCFPSHTQRNSPSSRYNDCMKARGLWSLNPIYLSSTLKILSEEHFAHNYLMIKAFEILIWMWNWEALAEASVSVFFSLLIQTSLSEGEERGSRGRREEGRERGRETHVWGNICVYVVIFV